MTIEKIGVVIPAHNEERLLARCLAAVRDATECVDQPVRTVVVLDRCDDRSREIVQRHPWVESMSIGAGNVGVARAVGAAAIVRWAGQTPSDRLWLATTDADSVVPVNWLSGQCALAAAGWEVVLGTVDVLDWADQPIEVASRWAADYQPVEDHPHVHGANFGCTAAAYLEAGGWSPLAAHEDVAMVEALAHRRVIRTATLPVLTSARAEARVVGGFADALRALAG